MIAAQELITVSIDEQYEIGFAHRCNGEYAEARAIFEKILAQAPTHIPSRWQMALILGFEGDFDGSLEGLKALAAESPNDLEIRYDFAMTQMMLGHLDEACAEFRAIVAADPTHEKATQQLIYCG